MISDNRSPEYFTGSKRVPSQGPRIAPIGPRVLVVEDQALIALALVADLAAMGCTVIGRASSGEHATDLAIQTAPDLVLMDVNLAGAMDGIEAASRIQHAGSARIVFITAFAEGPDRSRMDALRPAAVLGKPYDPDALAEVVQSCAARLWARRHEMATGGSAD